MPTVLLIYKARMFCQFLLSTEYQPSACGHKMTSVVFMWSIATAGHSTFFIWNLKVDCTSTLATTFSPWVSKEGDLSALFRSGLRIHGIFLIGDSDAKKPSYFLSSLLTSFFPSFFLLLFRAAYGSSQARDRIRLAYTTATTMPDLSHIFGNAAACGNAGYLTH